MLRMWSKWNHHTLLEEYVMELTWGYPVTQMFCTKGYTQETYGIQSSRWNSNREQKKRCTKNTKCGIPLV